MKSNRPNEADLIAYLYGELEDTEHVKMDRYFQENPEELEHLQQLKNTLSIMGQLKDKEVIAPPVLEERSNIRSFWQSSYVKIPMSIAASFLLIMVAGKLLGTEINYSNGQLSIRLGTPKEVIKTETAPALTSSEVQQMINESLANNNQTLAANWTTQQELLNKSIQNNLRNNSQKVDDLIKVASQASQDQVRLFVANLQTENLQMMKDYLQLSSTDQKKYIEGLLVDFSKYLQEQRKQDLTLFQTRMANIEQNTDQFKQETEQILASIISNPGGSKSNSY